MILTGVLLFLLSSTITTKACVDHSSAEFRYSFKDYDALQPSDFDFDANKLSALERIFAAQPNSQTARANLKYLTSKPHQAGTRQDRVLAQFMVKQFTEAGLDLAWIDPVPATVAYPGASPRVAILASSTNQIDLELKLSEDLLDSTSDVWDRNHTSLGYSPSGNVTGRVVYANFGTPQDFAELAMRNISCEGRIVLVRYGRCFRGLKVKNAQDRGAVGVLIYSDPMEDGYSVGPAYPQGPWRPASGVQRGSVQFNSLCAGDPDRAAAATGGGDGGKYTEKVCGYAPHELIPRIPALPLAWEDALPLLHLLHGTSTSAPPPPADFVGTLPNVTYELGPSPRQVWMQVTNRKETRHVWNAFGIIKGQHYLHPKLDRAVILGNHRDAWVFGAVDPNSGTAAMLEVARGLGMLVRMGWRPKRTILFASWSGEELGMLGSTAFGEQHRNLPLVHNAVAYVNVDPGVSGKTFQLGSTASLARLVRDVLVALPDPELPGKSLIARWPGNQTYSQLGTGSDYTVFIHHLGIPSLDMRFSPQRGNGGSATQYGVYHSDFDSFDWMQKHGDPKFLFHVALAKVFGVVAMRLADSAVLPFAPLDQARLVQAFVQRIEPMVPCEAAMRRMKQAAVKYVWAAQRIQAVKTPSRNDRLAFSERQFLHVDGLPLRKWYKHVLHAPSLFLGYDADFLPGVAQAYRDMKNATLAVEQAEVFTSRLLRVAAFLDGDGGDDDNGEI